MSSNEDNQINSEVPVQKNEGGSFMKKYSWVFIVILVMAVLIVGVTYYMWQSKKEKDNTKFEQVRNEEKTSSSTKVDIPGKMYFELVEGQVMVGEEFTLSLMMDTGGYNITAASGIFGYDPSVVEVISIDPNDEVMSMSAEKKIEADEVRIVRGQVGDANWEDDDDGFSGVGELARVTFKALNTGDLDLKFTREDSKLILDDGYGTAMRMEFGDFQSKIDN